MSHIAPNVPISKEDYSEYASELLLEGYRLYVSFAMPRRRSNYSTYIRLSIKLYKVGDKRSVSRTLNTTAFRITMERLQRNVEELKQKLENKLKEDKNE